MTATDIPEDLVEEILSRVPAASMKRLRSTCKRWNTLLRDGRFTNKHSGKAPKQSLILMFDKYRICPMRVNLNVAPPLIDFKDALSLRDSCSNSEQVDITTVFHCDGLLLCTTKDNRLVVWNPCLGETRWIQHKDGGMRSSIFALGYENTKSGRSYKILRYWRRRYGETKHEPVAGFETYEFRSDTWRVLDDVTLECLELQLRSVSLKGNTYWVDQPYTRNDLLYCFDFTKERFKRNSCLPQFQNYFYVLRALSVVGEEKLSVLNWNFRSPKMDIWVTDKIDTDTEAALTWSKLFTVDRVHTRSPMSFLLDEEKKVALCCIASNKTNNFMVCTIGEDGYTEIPYKEESTNKPWWQFIILSYVPSLVRVQQ